MKKLPTPQREERKEKKMDISLVLKVAGVGLIVTVACQILSKSGRDEQSMLVMLSGILLVMMLLMQELEMLLNTIRGIFGL